MNRVRIISLIAATLGVAVGAGTLFQQETMQQEGTPRAAAMQADTSLVGLAAPERVAAPEPEVPESSARSVSTQVATASVLPGMILTADPRTDLDHVAEAPAVDALLARAVTGVQSPQPVEEATLATDSALIEDLMAEVDACAIWLVVTSDSNAMLDMSLYAPCDGDERIEISHAGIRFDARLDRDGQLALRVPAMTPQAELTVSFDDGRTSSDAVDVPDAALYDRVAIQWQGQGVLGLNAYEFGADFGSDNHIHPSNPAAPGEAGRGFLITLGEESNRAQVYSFPSGLSARAGQVALELEVDVTDESCGAPLNVSTTEMLAGVEATPREIVIEMPACDGQGGFLVLKNLLPELTIALN